MLKIIFIQGKRLKPGIEIFTVLIKNKKKEQLKLLKKQEKC